MNQQHNIELIEQYLNNELSEAERRDLEEKIAGDETLADELDRRQMAHSMLDFMITENLRTQLKDLEAQDTKVISLQSRNRRMYSLAIAASVIILIGAFFFIWPSGGQLSNQQLAMEFYETPAFSMRGADPQSVTVQIANALQAINAQDYNAAIQNLEEVSNDNEYYTIARYYLGHAHFLNKDYQAAESDFAEVIAANDLRYHDDAQWYQLLSCKAQNRDCEQMLQSILSNPNHPFNAQALEMDAK